MIKMQRKITRLVMNVPPRSHTKPLMTKYNILNIKNLYIQRECSTLSTHENQHADQNTTTSTSTLRPSTTITHDTHYNSTTISRTNQAELERPSSKWSTSRVSTQESGTPYHWSYARTRTMRLSRKTSKPTSSRSKNSKTKQTNTSQL